MAKLAAGSHSVGMFNLFPWKPGQCENPAPGLIASMEPGARRQEAAAFGELATKWMQARSKRPYISLLTHAWLSYTSTFPSKRIINYYPDLNLTANTYRDPLICWATSTSRPATEHHSLTSIAESHGLLFIGGS